MPDYTYFYWTAWVNPLVRTYLTEHLCLAVYPRWLRKRIEKVLIEVSKAYLGSRHIEFLGPNNLEEIPGM